MPTVTDIFLNKEKIEELIPHRDPFLFLDKIKIVDPGVETDGYFAVKEESWFFKGHFPNYPIMPGVLIVESMAQTSAVGAIYSSAELAGKNTFFLKINNAIFRKGVFPGDNLIIKSLLNRSIKNAKIFDCTARTISEKGENIVVAEAQIMATIG
ncbi:beta-hydroxyacyl-ACP dehydratase [Anaplasmataceae bacterium AB001_6]|nr:beta-hydroxyacyl-ACP dehydratase [Anaplasmataceae bacterium AB001_6]